MRVRWEGTAGLRLSRAYRAHVYRHAREFLGPILPGEYLVNTSTGVTPRSVSRIPVPSRRRRVRLPGRRRGGEGETTVGRREERMVESVSVRCPPRLRVPATFLGTIAKELQSASQTERRARVQPALFSKCIPRARYRAERTRIPLSSRTFQFILRSFKSFLPTFSFISVEEEGAHTASEHFYAEKKRILFILLSKDARMMDSKILTYPIRVLYTYYAYINKIMNLQLFNCIF